MAARGEGGGITLNVQANLSNLEDIIFAIGAKSQNHHRTPTSCPNLTTSRQLKKMDDDSGGGDTTTAITTSVLQPPRALKNLLASWNVAIHGDRQTDDQRYESNIWLPAWVPIVQIDMLCKQSSMLR